MSACLPLNGEWLFILKSKMLRLPMLNVLGSLCSSARTVILDLDSFANLVVFVSIKVGVVLVSFLIVKLSNFYPAGEAWDSCCSTL